jgi:hypothetical protein
MFFDNNIVGATLVVALSPPDCPIMMKKRVGATLVVALSPPDCPIMMKKRVGTTRC